jgi:hypothetical protein
MNTVSKILAIAIAVFIICLLIVFFCRCASVQCLYMNEKEIKTFKYTILKVDTLPDHFVKVYYKY